MRIAGIVLAGGRSNRFGREKALAVLNGEPLIHWSLKALQSGAEIVAVNGPKTLCDRLDVPRVADWDGAAVGPLAGVLSGLGWAAEKGCSHVLTVPCDTPFLPLDMGARLAGEIAEATVIAARAARTHPLCALWRTDASSILKALVTEPNQPSIQAIIALVGGGWLDFPDELAFANLNTLAEFERAERRFAS